MAPNETDTTSQQVERTLETVLRPLSKIFILNGFSLKMGIETFKRALTSSALEDSDATDSLVSLRTGVHRKDVKRLRADLSAGVTGKFPIQGIAIVLATWTQQKPFCDGKGGGRVLARKTKGEMPGFDDMVKASKVDLAPATVLAEMLDQELVALSPNGDLELLSATFVGKTGRAALEAFEATVSDHVRIAAENVLSPPGAPRQFDRVLRYSHLSDASVARLEKTAHEMAATYLKTLNALAHQLQSEDDASGKMASGRFVTGVYVAPTSPAKGQHRKKKTQS